jgi:adenine-specific DNA-methyltransferase
VYSVSMHTNRQRVRGSIDTMHQTMLRLAYPPPALPREPKGVVYTKPWVVELLLDLADYSSDTNLVDALAVEPAAGHGAFLIPMARRLVTSCRRQNRPITDCTQSLIAYELDEASAAAARNALIDALGALDVAHGLASTLAATWVRSGDYLFDAFTLPRADFVLGNPPYIRLEDIPDELAGLHRQAFPTMRGRADLYVAFFEAALRQLKPGGVCAFICADRWMLNQYGAELRRLVTSRFAVEALIEMHDADPFDNDVSAYPALTVIRHGPQNRAVVASLGPSAQAPDATRLSAALRAAILNKPSPPLPGLSTATVQRWFRGTDPWPCSSPRRLALLRRLEDAFEPLESETQ